LMAVVYIWRIVEVAAFGSPKSAEAAAAGSSAKPNVPLALIIVVWVAAALNLIFGLMPAFPLGLAQEAASVLL